jgi:GT2 family glycosyltransferase
VLQQTLQPVEIILSVVKEEDFPHPERDFPPHVRRVVSPPGLTTQRNFGFKSLQKKTDFVTYIDDDVILHRDYLANMSQIFAKRKKVVCVMGHLLANGGVTLEEGKALCNSPPEDPNSLKEKYYATSATWAGLYGCNMSFKWEFLEQEKFDERLPLYSEMEDADMGTRARRHGEVGYYFACVGVHLDNKWTH